MVLGWMSLPKLMKKKPRQKGLRGLVDSENRTITIPQLPWFHNPNEASANTTLIQSEIKLIYIFKCSSNVTNILAPTWILDLSGFLQMAKFLDQILLNDLAGAKTIAKQSQLKAVNANNFFDSGAGSVNQLLNGFSIMGA